jgi:hypothetical protein
VQPRPSPPRSLRRERDDDRDAFGRVTIGQGFPGAAGRRSLHCLRATRGSRTVLASEPLLLRVSAPGGVLLWPAPRASLFLADRGWPVHGGASDRLLPSHVFVRAPAPRWFPVRHALGSARARWGIACSRQCDSLRRAARPGRDVAAGVVFPRRCVSAVPLAPLSPPPRNTPRSRAGVLSRGPPRSPPSRSRERVSRRRTTRGTFRRARAFAPRRSLERPAPAWNDAAV